MRILNITQKEREIIESGNLPLLRIKIAELEKIWFSKLVSTNTDHRYVQGVYTVISDIKEVLN